jgi:hypothetical protein
VREPQISPQVFGQPALVIIGLRHHIHAQGDESSETEGREDSKDF